MSNFWINNPFKVTFLLHMNMNYVFIVVEKDLNMGDHGYARRQPPVDSEEDGVQRAEEERPCSLCQHYKTKLEQQQQHTVRLQREVTFIPMSHKNISD